MQPWEGRRRHRTLAYAKQLDANLLVMGGFAHGFERELMLGSATRDIFGRSRDTGFLSH